jgi:hypothetical protein
MSITNVKKRIACFYDDKGEFLSKKGFSKTAKTFDYDGKSYNIYQDDATATKVKRWYWDLEEYHYNINNPNPMLLNKKAEPILDSEMYNIQLKTKVARDLNDLSKKGLFANLDFKTAMVILIVIVVIYMLATGKIKL